jgi:outer membrane protein TolC
LRNVNRVSPDENLRIKCFSPQALFIAPVRRVIMDDLLRLNDSSAMNRTGGSWGAHLFFVAGSVITLLSFGLPPTSGQTAAPDSTSKIQLAEQSPVQLIQLAGLAQAAPITVTLKDALERAQKLDPLLEAAGSDAKTAREDRLQARNALLPNFTATSQYLNTEGNGATPDGRFVTNDGVHVYRDWLILHQDLSPASLMLTGYHRATAAEALASAKVEIARRGLRVTVTKTYYAMVVAQRKYATTQEALAMAKNFLDLSQDLEGRGQVPHSDVVKAQIQYSQEEAAFDDANLEMENARLELAVLLFPTLNENFSVVDDLDVAQPLPAFSEVQSMASRGNPELQAALQAQRESDLDVTTAKTVFLPTLTIETDYGIEANEFALRSKQAAFPDIGPLPNLGYFLTASLNLPVWDWGTLRSKLRQAEYRRDTAKVQLGQTQRELLSDLYSYYNEATVSRASVDRLRETADLATESLRLVTLRYQGGLSTVFEVVDAETTLTQALNAYDDGLIRYRTALATLQTVTGSF